MQFYKFEGFTVSENWSEENNDRRVMREKVRKNLNEDKLFQSESAA